MKKKFFFFLLLPFFSFASVAHAELWSGILDPSRAIDWSQTGIPGGIPGRTTICATINAATYGNGINDATAGIQNSLNTCPANETVLLSAGTFRINSNISIPSNVTLRGAGANQTILDLHGTNSSAAVIMGNADPQSANVVSITGGTTAGSQNITVSSATAFAVGGYAIISELNDPSYVTSTGNGGTCTWCDVWYNGTRVRGQIVEVTSINGTTIGFTPALYTSYSHTPQAVPFTASDKYAGIEDLQFYANNTGYAYNVFMDSCAYCWVKGIEGNYVDGNGNHVEIQFGYRDEIRDNYFSSAYRHTNGTTENEIHLAYKTSGALIENNIFERVQTSVNLGDGSAGNVVAYNYATGNFDESDQALGSMGAIYFHGAHPQFNLVEGNVVPAIYPDSVWGSSSDLTVFRNWAEGTTKSCVPTTGRGTVDCSGTSGVWEYKAARAMQIDGLSTSDNFVGNVVGSSQQSALSTTKSASIQWPSSRSWEGAYGWTWGYTSLGDGGTNSFDSTNAYTTALLHGNYNNIDGSLSWANGLSQALPASFFLSSKPSWWGSTPYPAIGPDISGGSGPGGHTYAIPAQVCFASIGGVEGGANSPLNFNADSCYSSTVPDTTPPAAPTGVTVQ